MWEYEHMKEVVIRTAFIFILLFDAWGIGYWVTQIVKWVWKKFHKAKKMPAEEKTAK